MTKVSIIIPAYNAMDYLPETMSSVLEQSFDDFDIVVVNDGSTDNIEDWLIQFDTSQIQIITQRNQGLAAARNTGIKNSTGEYLAFLDADDLWSLTKLERQVELLDKNPEVGLVYTWVANINEESQRTGRVLRHEIEGDVWRSLIIHNFVECGSVPMVRRCCFETCGLFDTELGSFLEDWDMWLRIASYYSFGVVKEPLVSYRQHATSASKNWAAMTRSFEILINKAFMSQSAELEALKRQSYGHFYLFCLAWKPLQSEQKDYRKALNFRQQALVQDPKLRFSREDLRLSVAISLMQWLGPQGYSRLLKFGYSIRRHFQHLSN
ncbi:MAG: glycosyltransferase family 2 protein [Acaryochloridaceae cyanobacterium SU_2_1]|nr:glycosyltransferase family 2 protein [Acaryochloridaceae cyanobacterium SU_2_1]